MESEEKSLQFMDNPSFVIIKRISAENQKQIELTDNLLKNSVFNLMIEKFNPEIVTRNPLFAEEIERNVNDVFKENALLKETLQQNTAMMKKQLTTFSKLHEEVFKIHQSHKQKFDETKDLVLKLRAENQELKKIGIRNIEICNESQFIQEKNFSQQKLCTDPKCASFKSAIFTENRLLKQKLGELKQNLTMTSRSDKEQELLHVITDLTKQLENSERCKRKLTFDVDRLTALEVKLQRILSAGDSRNVTDCCYWNALFPSVVISTPLENQLIENMKRYEELLNASENMASGPTQTGSLSDGSLVNFSTNNDEETLQLIKSDVDLCYKLLSQEQAISAFRKELLDNVRSNFKEIYKQCLTILKGHDARMKAQEIESVKTKEKLKEIDNLRRELIDKQNMITHLEVDLSYANNLFQKKLQEAERKNEEMSLLRSQIKMYEEDFISERHAKESLSNEKELLEHRLNGLKLRNDELLKKLKMSRDENVENMKEIIEKKSVPQMNYTCFNETCDESFTSEDELQQHVYSCLNIKD